MLIFLKDLCKLHIIKMQFCCPGTKGPALCEDDDLYEDFNMDEMDLNLENYEELFGVTLSHSEELLENGGINSLFGTKDISAADSNCQGAVAAEVLSICPIFMLLIHLNWHYIFICSFLCLVPWFKWQCMIHPPFMWSKK